MRLCLAAILIIGAVAQVDAKTIVAHDDARDYYLATLEPTSAEKFDDGLAACDRAIESVRDDVHGIALAPDLSAAYLNRDAGLVGLGRYEEALAALQKAIALGISDKLHLAYFNSGVAKEQLGDVRGAYDDCKRPLEIQPNFAPAKEQLSRFTVVTKPAD